ncbi:xylulokinase [Anoxynatronum sibiricum]|uniref:Xylulose kinase n=1 Tax=Anoxynatronum sibiricum TaxID=210623 RepID=A0ABU9VSP2_9CLOT
MYYIGADLGTTGLKMILMDETGRITASQTEKYPIAYPFQNWAEQEPTDWFNALVKGIRKLTKGIAPEAVKAIGIDGQMHGLVMLDSQDQVIRPAILWNDTRTTEEVTYLNDEIGKSKLSELTGNIAFAGFTAPKIMWVRKNEPENFEKMKHVMLPKDYLNYMLTGILSSDYSDASGMLLLDVEKKQWSQEMMAICHITEANLPKLYESYQVVGTLKSDMAEKLGLGNHVKVVAGAGDNAAAAIGAGTVGDGRCNISIGTSGTVFVASKDFKEGKNHAVHHFAHADGTYHFLGCMLSAASCNDWWMEKILGTNDYSMEQNAIEDLGHNHLIYLPYLMGERSPHNDPNARGAFLGLSMGTTRQQMTQAVLEGVAFGLRDSLEVIREAGVVVTFATFCGGGAKSKLWQQMVANILGIEVGILDNEEGPALGSAILAAVGDGLYENVEEACQAIVTVKEVVKPDQEIVEKYNRLYQVYKNSYHAVKGLHDQLSSQAKG